MSTVWIKNPLYVWTGTESGAAGGIVVEGEAIAELVGAGEVPRTPIDSTLDADGFVVIPGLVNCHHHFYQTLTRAYPGAFSCGLFEWLKRLYSVWAMLEEDDIQVSTQAAIAELMLSGCTTAVDHHYLFTSQINQAVDIQAETAKAAGMRVVLCRGSMSLGESGGGLPPDYVVQDEGHILRECERLIKKFAYPATDSMVQLVLAPCSPFSVTPDLMKASAGLARNHGILLHTHLAETTDETNYCLKNYGMRPVEYLESVGWLEEDVWLAHGIHFNDAEIKALGRYRTAICHCPSSNMMLGSGHCRVVELEKAGCPVGLGVDGSSSNDCSNMMGELRQAFLLQRLYYGPERVTHLDVLRWGTSGGARVLHREDIGTLEVGKQADIALFGLDDIEFSGSHDPLSAMILCGARRVSFLMTAGQWKVWKGELVDMDLEKLRIRHRRAARNLVKRMADSSLQYTRS